LQKLYFFDKKKHGTADFPVEYFYVDSAHPRYYMAFHWHNEWELIRVIEGELLIFLDDRQQTVRAGEIVLIPSETLHGGQPKTCVYECLVFDLYALLGKIDSLKPQLRPFLNMEIIPENYFTNNHTPVSCIFEIFSQNTESPCKALETLSAICGLFAWLIKEKRYRKTQNVGRRSVEIKPVLEYIETHYSEDLSLETLAGVAGMNARYFCKIFYSATKNTPMNYVNQYRIEHASFLLDTTDLSITEIATNCGFYDSSYFTKVFKKFKNTTPKQFRYTLAKGFKFETTLRKIKNESSEPKL